MHDMVELAQRHVLASLLKWYEHDWQTVTWNSSSIVIPRSAKKYSTKLLRGVPAKS